MSDLTEVYVVTVGSYSDYRVDSAWTVFENAEERVKFLKNLGGYENEYAKVETYALDKMELFYPDDICWRIVIREDGSVFSVSGEVGGKCYNGGFWYNQSNDSVTFTTYTKQKDRELAIKVAKEEWRSRVADGAIDRTRLMAEAERERELLVAYAKFGKSREEALSKGEQD